MTPAAREAGLAVVREIEECELEAYKDPGSKRADGEPITIGWGHTDPGVIKLGDTCTQEQADMWLEEDAAEAEAIIEDTVQVSLSDNQAGALLSFVYNIGEGQWRKSTLLRKLNTADYAGAAAEFPKWNKNDGKIMNGLIRRRRVERALFEKTG